MNTTPNCSFCNRPAPAVDKLLAGPPGVAICGECLELCNRIVAGQTKADFEGWETRSDDDLLDALAYSDRAVDVAREALQAQVEALRSRKVSWSRIGERLGVSRQSAWERFS